MFHNAFKRGFKVKNWVGILALITFNCDFSKSVKHSNFYYYYCYHDSTTNTFTTVTTIIITLLDVILFTLRPYKVCITKPILPVKTTKEEKKKRKSKAKIY